MKTGCQGDWHNPGWGAASDQSALDFLLGDAVAGNRMKRAEWLLTHGADANTTFPWWRLHPGNKRTVHEEALLRGYTEMADLLLRFGATPAVLELQEEPDPFQMAYLRLDRIEARALVEEHPEYLLAPGLMMEAARRDWVDGVAFLLDLGMSPDIEDPGNGRQRPLHVAAGHDSPGVAALLIESGAEIDFRESNWGATPLGFAVHQQKPRMIELLSRVSRDVWNLTFTGSVERLRELLQAEPELAKVVRNGHTPLMRLPDDETRAIEIVELFLSYGADLSLRNREGMTAAECARKRGIDEVAGLLHAEE
jgi:ankyrin repeat protein